MRRGALLWERVAVRWTDAVVCVSEAERRRGEKAGVRGAWRVIPNGVDLAAYSPATSGERAAARARLRLPANPLVVCVGRLSRQKGQDVLLAAWPMVRQNVPDWLAAADVVAAPSRWEGMSIAVLEALARARPVVAADTPGAAEAIGDEAGAVVPIEDASRLADELAVRLRDPRRAQIEGRKARERVERLFDVRRTTAAHAALYEELARPA